MKRTKFERRRRQKALVEQKKKEDGKALRKELKQQVENLKKGYQK